MTFLMKQHLSERDSFLLDVFTHIIVTNACMQFQLVGQECDGVFQAKAGNQQPPVVCSFLVVSSPSSAAHHGRSFVA